MDNLKLLSNTAVVENVQFRLRVQDEKRKTGRKLLIISTDNLDLDQKLQLEKAYWLDQSEHISFPMKERGKHLKVRIEKNVYNFGRFIVNFIPRFRTKKWRMPEGKALEVVLSLTDSENEKLGIYLNNIKKRRARTIGGFHMEGFQYSNGKIDDNLAHKNGHNCSSWIGTAPLGESYEPLIEVLGGNRSMQVATNPGWWTNWLAAYAPDERIPYIIYWTNKSLSEALSTIQSGTNLDWDFYRH